MSMEREQIQARKARLQQQQRLGEIQQRCDEHYAALTEALREGQITRSRDLITAALALEREGAQLAAGLGLSVAGADTRQLLSDAIYALRDRLASDLSVDPAEVVTRLERLAGLELLIADERMAGLAEAELLDVLTDRARRELHDSRPERAQVFAETALVRAPAFGPARLALASALVARATGARASGDLATAHEHITMARELYADLVAEQKTPPGAFNTLQSTLENEESSIFYHLAQEQWARNNFKQAGIYMRRVASGTLPGDELAAWKRRILGRRIILVLLICAIAILVLLLAGMGRVAITWPEPVCDLPALGAWLCAPGL